MKHYLLFGVMILLAGLMMEADVYADTFSENMYACQQKCKKQKTYKDPCCVKRCAYYACIDHHSIVTTRGGQAVVDPAARDAAVVPCFPHMQVLVTCVKKDIANKERIKNRKKIKHRKKTLRPQNIKANKAKVAFGIKDVKQVANGKQYKKWTFKRVFTEKNGVGVTFSEKTYHIQSADMRRKPIIKKRGANIRIKPGGSYIEKGSLWFSGKQDMHLNGNMHMTFKGRDDNGNEIIVKKTFSTY